MNNNYKIKIEYDRDSLFDKLGMERLRDSYMREDEQSPQERYAYVSKVFSSNEAHAQRMYEYSSKHWISYATPILSFGRSNHGLPISCFLNWIPDTAKGLVDNLSETNWLSMMGGGVGVGFGIRSSGDKSTGVISHLKTYDASSLAYRQGSTRRGSYAAYLDITHPDIKMFMDIRKPTGDQNLRAYNLNHGINIPDEFMEIIEKCMTIPGYDDSIGLRDPHTNKIIEVVSAKALWEHLMNVRRETGEPYMLFIDTANKALPEHLKALGLKIRQSNLCSEIVLPTDIDRTAVCCLSSFNLSYYDEWMNDMQFFRDVAEFLDNVLQYFIDNAPDTIARAKYSAMRERSIGLGALGFHSYLQQKNIPFESALAVGKNLSIFKTIRAHLDVVNLELGLERGEAPDAIGTGKRFSHVMAIAPNATSSIVCGNISPSIEPYKANIYRQDTLSGASITRNKYLDLKISALCVSNDKLNYDDIWSSIMSNDGSIAHLECFDDWTKKVFRTAIEIDQRWIIQHAADRQPFIDQAQSVNVFFKPNCDVKYFHAVHFMAWKLGLKSLYYCRSEKIGRADKIGQSKKRDNMESININISDLISSETCLACEG